MLIALSKEHSNTKHAAQAGSDAFRLDEFVVALHKDFSEGFRGCNENPGFIEQPPIVQDAVIRDIVDPIALRFACWFFEYPSEMAEQDTSILSSALD